MRSEPIYIGIIKAALKYLNMMVDWKRISILGKHNTFCYEGDIIVFYVEYKLLLLSFIALWRY